MKKLLILFTALIFSEMGMAQTTLTGRVTDAKGDRLAGVNVYVKATYDGASTDDEGRYTFRTTATGPIVLSVSFVGYESAEKRLDANGQTLQTDFRLQEQASELNTVVITAGSFEASDTRKSTILKPLDIVTTAGANADIFAAIQTLPGVGRVGEEEGLFVRGGAASETKTLIDGMIVENPFFSPTPDVAQRGRFSPFLFRGTAFSSGGYSAQYGQALSSVLALETQDLADQTQSSIGLTAVGPTLSHTQRWKKTSLSADAAYTNLGPLFAVVRQNVDWQQPPTGLGGSFILRHQPTATSMLKVYSTYNSFRSAMQFRDWLNFGQFNSFRIRNNNLYTNASYRNAFGEGKWVATAGVSYSHNDDQIGFNTDRLGRDQERLQARGTLFRVISDKVSVLTGGEIHHYTFGSGFNQFSNRRQDVYSALFAESEIYIIRKLAGRIGVRGEHSRLIGAFNLAPRVSLAYKMGTFSQVSFAWGEFFQNPENRYLLVNTDLNFEKAAHYILNYQIMKNKRTFRVEGYYKTYNHLVKEYGQTPFDPNRNRFPSGPTNNGGTGYARGADIFWRDQKTFKNIDYWISYSFLDTERNYQNFPTAAMPTFASRHNVSLVYKQFVAKIRSSIGITHNFASGRPYYNPNAETFMSDRTRPFNALGINISYLTQIQGNFTVIFLSANNVLGTRNVFGYRYSPDGVQRQEIGQPADRGFFAGMFVSIGRKPYWQAEKKGGSE